MDDRGRSGNKRGRRTGWMRRARVPSGFALIGLVATVVLSLGPVAASALADAESGATPLDDAVVALTGQEVVPAGEAPADDGSTGLDVDSAAGPPVSPDPLPLEPPVGEDAAATDTAVPPDPQVPDAGDPAVPPPAETDDVEVAVASDHPNADPAGPTRDSDAAPVPAPAVPAPAVVIASAAPPTAPAGVVIVLIRAAHHASRTTSPRRGRAVAPPWERPGSLMRALVAPAWHASARPLSFRQVPLTPDRRAASSLRHADGKAVTPQPPERPLAPRAPGSSACVASSSCGAGFLAMVPPLAALGCLCALLFERLLEAMSLWPPRRFLSLRERPG